ITVFNSNLSPSLDLTLGYKIAHYDDSYGFLGFNMLQFYAFDKSDLFRSTNVFSTLNLEFGLAKRKAGLMQGKSSFGFGALQQQGNLGMLNNKKAHWMGNGNLSYALSNTVGTS